MTKQEKLIKLASMLELIKNTELPQFLPGMQIFKIYKEAVVLLIEIVEESEVTNAKN